MRIGTGIGTIVLRCFVGTTPVAATGLGVGVWSEISTIVLLGEVAGI